MYSEVVKHFIRKFANVVNNAAAIAAILQFMQRADETKIQFGEPPLTKVMCIEDVSVE